MTVQIETERLILRPLTEADTEHHIEMMTDPDVAAFLTPEHRPRDRSDEWRAFASILGHWQIRGFGFFAVEEKETGQWVGRVGPWMPEGWPAIECGWAISKPYWGKGYAPEAAIASISWIFRQFPELPRIISIIDPKNQNSQAVARKIGESHCGEQFDYWGIKLDIWAADRESWLRKLTGGTS